MRIVIHEPNKSHYKFDFRLFAYLDNDSLWLEFDELKLWLRKDLLSLAYVQKLHNKALFAVEQYQVTLLIRSSISFSNCAKSDY